MAFNQVEVMIKNLHGQELNLTSGQMVAATAAADAQQGQGQLPPTAPAPAIDPQ